MPFKKGISGNSKGRPNGHQNKSKLLYESMVEFFLSGEMEKFKTEMDKLSGEKYINVVIKLGSLVNANKEKDYTYINEVLAPIFINKLKSLKNENTKTS